MLRDIRETFAYILSQIENPVPDDRLGHQGVRFLCPLHPDTDPSARVYITDDYQRIMAGCFGCQVPYTEFARHWGIRPSDMCPHREEAERDPIVATYEYRDENGNVRYEVCRRVSKKFPQRRVMHDGSWAWSLKAGKYRKGHGGDWYLVKRGQDSQPSDVSLPKVDKLLYNLPAIKNMDLSKTVLIVEGEKDADRVMLEAGESGHVATTSSAGAGKWTEQDTNALRGIHCVSVPDWDRPNPQTRTRPGSKHAQLVANSLLGKARSVRVLELSDLKEGEDVSDWFDKGHTFNELLDLARATTPWADGMQLEGAEVVAIDSNADAEWLQNSLGIFIVGQEADEQIKIFSLKHKRVFHITPREVENLKMRRIDMWSGEEATRCVTSVLGEATADKRHISEIGRLIMLIGPTHQIIPENLYGIGTWRIENEDGPDAIVLCNGSHLSVLNGAPLEKIAIPEYQGKLFDFRGDSRNWFDHETLAGNLESAQYSHFREETIAEMHTLFGRFQFKNGQSDVQLMIGHLLCTHMQSVWKLRPQVSLVGKTSAGKTTFLRVVKEFFGERICRLIDKPTAAFIRQENGNNTIIFLMDEMEKAPKKQREEVYHLLKTSTLSSEIGRGSASGTAISSKMNCIAWIAGIESGLVDESDVNRYTQTEFIVPKGGHRGSFDTGTPISNFTLGGKAQACILTCWEETQRIAALLTEHRPEGIERRVAEVHALPAAAYGVIANLGEENIKPVFEAFLKGWMAETDADTEGDFRLLEYVTQCPIRVGTADMAVSTAISSVLRNDDDGHTAEDALGIVGIRALPNSQLGEPGGIFMHCSTVSQNLLRGSEWDGKKISSILGRITGVQRQVSQRVCRVRKKGLLFSEDIIFPKS